MLAIYFSSKIPVPFYTRDPFSRSGFIVFEFIAGVVDHLSWRNNQLNDNIESTSRNFSSTLIVKILLGVNNVSGI